LVRDDIVWRVEALTLEIVGDDLDRPVMLPTHDAAIEILARKLAALEIERVAVGVVRRPAKRDDPLGVPQIAVLGVAGDVAEHEVLALARPGRTLRPLRPGPQPLHR